MATAVKVGYKNPQIFYDLALLHNEMYNKDAALLNFEKAYLHLSRQVPDEYDY
ncbi:MAG: hypothetical protein ABI172_10010 [Ginsengibacter sp.]